MNAPNTNLCNAGTTGAVTQSGNNWIWACNGQNGGTNASCLATVSGGNQQVCTGSDLSTLSASTFIGGNNLGTIGEITQDFSGNIYAITRATQGNLPTTIGSYDT